MRELIFEIETLLSGRFKLIARNPVTGKSRLLIDWFDNLILDQGLDYPGKQADYLYYCHVGTGSNAAAESDTTLQTFYDSTQAESSPAVSAQSSAPYYGEKRFTYIFDAATENKNFTEIGVGKQAADGGLFSRVKLAEVATVLTGEILEVLYELRIYPDHLTVTSTTVIISAVSYDIDILAASVTDSNFWGSGLGDIFEGLAASAWTAWDATAALGAVTAQPSGVDIGNATSVTKSSYSDSSYQLDLNVLYGTGDANDPEAVGIGALLMASGCGAYQVKFVPVIPKTNVLELRLIWRQTWARKSL